MARNSRRKTWTVVTVISLLLAIVASNVYMALQPKKLKTEQLQEAPKPTQLFAIVRLHDAETGRFFCSGSVISDKYVLTASHCVVREGLFSLTPVERV
jgi:secreted trypsin-like serine protease